MHSELSYGLLIAPKLQRVGSIHIPGWDQPTPDPSFSLQCTVCSGNPSPFLGGNPLVHGVIGVLPRPYGRLPTAQCIEGSRRSTVINLCRPLWRALASGLCCTGSRLIYQQVSLPPPGGTPERSAPFQKCGLALLSRLTILASMVVPSFSSCRVSPPRGVDQRLLRRKIPFRIFSQCQWTVI